MKPCCEFRIDCGPGTLWKLNVFVWPTIRALRSNRDGDGKVEENIAIAFCRTLKFAKAHETGIIAEMHFHRDDLRPSIVVHEAAHAMTHYAMLVRLDTNTKAGDEQFAESIEHVVAGTLWSFKNLIKKPTKRKRKK